MSDAGRQWEAEREYEKALRLNPLDPLVCLAVGTVLFVSRDYDRALAVLGRGAKATPDFIGLHAVLALTYAEMGRMEEARAAVAEMLRINPEFSIEEVASRNLQGFDPESAERFLAAARKAGIPEQRPDSGGDDS